MADKPWRGREGGEMDKRLCEDEKTEMKKVIEFKLREKGRVLIDPATPDDKFFDALRDVCSLNMLRDEIKK